MIIPVFCIGVTHKNTDINIRKLFSFSNEEIAAFLKKLLAEESESIAGAVIISTCNRIEWYFSLAAGFADSFSNCENKNRFLHKIEEAISRQKNVEISVFRQHSFSYFGEETIKHLFQVSGGLDSMILGENQILGQVRESYLFAKNSGFTDFYLNCIFQKALSCAKRIKTETEISKATESTATLAVKEIMKIKGQKTIMVLGSSGQTGSLIVKDLSEREKVKVFATIRKHNTLPELKNVEILPYENRYEVMDRTDVIVSCTKSPHYTLLFEKTRNALKTQKERLFLDLAVPNDIDPEIAKLSGCILKDIDSFRKIAEQNNIKKRQCVFFANEIVEEEIDSIKKEILFHNNIEFFEAKKNELKNKNALNFFYQLKKNASAAEVKTLLNLVRKTLDNQREEK